MKRAGEKTVQSAKSTFENAVRYHFEGNLQIEFKNSQLKYKNVKGNFLTQLLQFLCFV